MTTAREYPECDKFRAVASQSQVIGEFVEEFLNDKGICLAEWVNVSESGVNMQLRRVYVSIETLLAEFFDIDLGKIEAEKLAMLAALRKMQGMTP